MGFTVCLLTNHSNSKQEKNSVAAEFRISHSKISYSFSGLEFKAL
jgi:hypothetical protein